MNSLQLVAFHFDRLFSSLSSVIADFWIDLRLFFNPLRTADLLRVFRHRTAEFDG